MSLRDKTLIAVLSTALLWSGVEAHASEPLEQLHRAEAHYADYVDALGAVGLIESGYAANYEGKDQSAWQRVRDLHHKQVTDALALTDSSALKDADRRAFEIMRAAVTHDVVTLAPTSDCADATRTTNAARRAALYACFEEHANQVAFNDRTLTRVAAMDLLSTLDDSRERRALFMAFRPLWRSINADNAPSSPYRKMLAEFVPSTDNVHVSAAASAIGIDTATVKKWLIEVLTTWRQVVRPAPTEPWDYRYNYGRAERQLGLELSAAQMQSIASSYFEQLGANPKAWDVIYDLAPRAGKAPLAYADFLRRGRSIDGRWHPTIARVSGSYATGRLGMLNELVHEMTHVAHMMALKTRPAFMDLGDALFYEAVADVASWSLYERDWQMRYLTRTADARDSKLALLSGVMLDVAWGLFDLTMLEQPNADPNAVWTDITHKYLNIVPHPDIPWWCLRVQLVDSPGYMINYALGSIVTADLRARVRERIGPFSRSNDRWSSHLADHLLRSGAEYPTRDLLKRFLGRDVSPAALVHELRGLAGQ